MPFIRNMTDYATIARKMGRPTRSEKDMLDDLSIELEYHDIANAPQYAVDDILAIRCIVTWVCTDTQAGLFAMYLHDELVALISKMSRKAHTHFHWVSTDRMVRTRTALIALCPDELPAITTLDDYAFDIDDAQDLYFGESRTPVPIDKLHIMMSEFMRDGTT